MPQVDNTLSDIQLIKEVKSNNDSKALEELIHRHTGIYYQIINKYSYIPQLEKNELMNDKMYNIYQYILDFKEEKNVKLSTYIGERVKYECLNIITNKIETEEIDNNLEDKIETPLDKEFIDLLVKESKNVDDARFAKIIQLRFLAKEPQTLREIGEGLGITKERVRQIFEDNIKILRKRLNNNLLD